MNVGPHFVRACSVASLALAAASTWAQSLPLGPVESDPARMGWMVGSPPPSDRLIQFADGSHLRFPQLRRSVANFRRFVPSTNVWRGDGPVAVLPRALREDIDAIVVLHKGRFVYERYLGVMTPHTQHMSMSVTKSIFGTLGAMLVEEGTLDERAPVTKHVVR